MGTRGPLKGQGGRPTEAIRQRKAAPPKRVQKAEFATDLSGLTFDRLVEMCGEWQTLTGNDQIVVAAFWDCVQRYRDLSAELATLSQDDLTYSTVTGAVQPVPIIKMHAGALAELLVFAAKFGMSPADRARQAAERIVETEAESPFGDHMAQVKRASGKVKAQHAAAGR